MVLKPGREGEAEAIFRKWELDFAVIGEVTDTGAWNSSGTARRSQISRLAAGRRGGPAMSGLMRSPRRPNR